MELSRSVTRSEHESPQAEHATQRRAARPRPCVATTRRPGCGRLRQRERLKPAAPSPRAAPAQRPCYQGHRGVRQSPSAHLVLCCQLIKLCPGTSNTCSWQAARASCQWLWALCCTALSRDRMFRSLLVRTLTDRLAVTMLNAWRANPPARLRLKHDTPSVGWRIGVMQTYVCTSFPTLAVR